MFNTHNICMAVGGGLIIVSILALNYSLWVSVPIFTFGAYLAFIRAPRVHLGDGGESTDNKASALISRKSPCPCGSGKKYKNCCSR